MKRASLILFATFALYSCKKEKAAETEDYTETAVTVPETNEPQSPAPELKENSVAQISNILKAPSADTLYVTNFFATWCGPCIRELPHFREKMNQLEGKPVKFTFVSLDDKSDWPTKVREFAGQQCISQNTVLLDGEQLMPDFFSTFSNWKGESIPFTFMKKGDKTEQIVGGISAEELDAKLKTFGF